MRSEITRLHGRLGNTMIYVTHDQVEAMTMADKIVVLRLGVVEQVGAPLDLYNDPANRFVAGFIGSPRMNFFDGQVKETLPEGTVVGIAGIGDITCAARPDGVSPGEPISLGVRPEHISAGQAATNTADVKVSFTEQLGSDSYLYCELPTGVALTIHTPGQTDARMDDMIPVNFPPDRCYVFKKDKRESALPRRA